MIPVYKTCCKNCLFSDNRIVAPEVADFVIQEAYRSGSYFICHKSSMSNMELNDLDSPEETDGEDDTYQAPRGNGVCCAAWYANDKLRENCTELRLQAAYGLTEFIEQPDTKKLLSWKEQQSRLL